MPAEETMQLTLEAHLERVFALIESPDWLKDASYLYQTEQSSKPQAERKIYAIYNLSRNLESSQPLMSLRLCEHARTLSQEMHYEPGLAWYWREVASIHQALGNMVQAKDCIERGLVALKRLGFRAGVASCLNILGNITAVAGHFDQAIGHYRQYVKIARELGRRDSEQIGLANIAETHLDMGQPWQALEVLLESQRSFEAMDYGLDTQTWTRGLIGRAYRDLGDPNRALHHLLEALAMSQHGKDLHFKSILLAMIAESQIIYGDLQAAQEALNEAIELNARHGNQSQHSGLLSAQAELHRLRQEHEPARASATKALEIALEIQDRLGEIKALIELAALNTALNPTLEITHLKNALEVSTKIQTQHFNAKIHGLLSASYQHSGRPALALEHLQAQRQIELDLQRSEAEYRIRNLSIQFEINEAERETQHERQRNQALETANLENTRLLETLRLQTEQLERLAAEDALTGLANRRTLEQLLPREIERARRYTHPISVAFADIDHFKLVNDRFGHAIGDLVLKRISQIFLEQCRTMDVIARFGGEEFVLVLPETSLEAAIVVCERIRNQIQTHDWSSIRAGLEITMSFGMNADTSLDANGMLDAADTQLYSAKQHGRNRVTWQLA
jgi:diguanylate cyclase (GGDEF)-like protein